MLAAEDAQTLYSVVAGSLRVVVGEANDPVMRCMVHQTAEQVCVCV